jgi:type I restriction enzyme, S subunit
VSVILSKEKVPDYWEIVPLGTVCLKATKVKRKEVDNEKKLIYLDIGSINNLTNRITEHKVYKWKNAPSRAQQIVKVEDILFSTVRVYLRNIAKIDNPLYEDQICSSGFTVIRGCRDCCDPRYLFTISLYEGFLQPLNELQTGTSYPAVRDNDVFNQLIPLPPLPEQRAIVSKIEQLFSELDNGITNLKLAQEQLKVYRQAVLKKAFEGELTRKWREQQTDLPDAGDLLEQIRKEREKAVKYSGKNVRFVNNFIEEELNELIKLPNVWKWVKIGELCDVVRGGSPRPAGDPKFYDGDIPFLKVADLTRNKDIYLKEHEYSIKEAGLKKTRLVEQNTLLLSNSGATLGVPKICSFKTTFNDGIAAFLDLAEESLVFHYYFWLSKTKELRAINQGAAQPNLNTDIIANYPFPLCSLSEQQAIVQEIETRLSICEKIEQDIETNLEKAEALRQSILKKAFEGKLLNEKELAEVRRAEDWEQADVLLEKIRAEKEINRKS